MTMSARSRETNKSSRERGNASVISSTCSFYTERSMQGDQLQTVEGWIQDKLCRAPSALGACHSPHLILSQGSPIQNRVGGKFCV
jgi:hypothetical protein